MFRVATWPREGVRNRRGRCVPYVRRVELHHRRTVRRQRHDPGLRRARDRHAGFSGHFPGNAAGYGYRTARPAEMILARSLHIASARHIRCASMHLGLLASTSKCIIGVTHRNPGSVLEACTSMVRTWTLTYKPAHRSANPHVSRACVDLPHANEQGPGARMHVNEHACTSLVTHARR